jgi:tetratricopeptide (TPR) repeat protein
VKTTLALAMILACGCAASQPTPPSSPPLERRDAGGPAEPARRGGGPPRLDTPLVFIENDYGRALADARARHLPLFVDAWATWCHTCLSMRSYVFPDPALRRFGARFVWLSVDTEREENAPLVSRLGVRVLPTLYVVDPATEQPVLAWPGSLTATELGPLLEDAELAVRHGGSEGDAGAALLRGQQATAAGKIDEALVAYRASLAAAPVGWARRPQAVDALVTSLADAKQLAACVTAGADEAPRLPPGTALADVLRAAMGCAEDLPKDAPERSRLDGLATLGAKVASDASQPVLADDRSDLYDYVVHALRGAGREDESRQAAHAWATFLEGEAAHASTPAARAVFDAHRLLAYLAIGAPEKAIPMLEQSEHDFPDDYNPPARLATAYLKLGRLDDALAAIHRALGRAYGPRKLRLWALEADVHEARKDPASARKALREALDFAAKVPLTGGYPRLRDALQKRLAALQ